MLALKIAGMLGILSSIVFASHISRTTLKVREPESKTLSELNINVNGNSIAFLLRKQLVADTEDNKDGGSGAYKNRLLINKENYFKLDPIFSKVTHGYGEDKYKSLNKVCSKSYEIQLEHFKYIDNSFIKQLEKFCSVSN